MTRKTRKPAPRTKKPRKPQKARKAQKARVYTPTSPGPLPPRTWAVDRRDGHLAHDLAAETAIMRALAIWPVRDLPSWVEETGFSYVAWWHSALAARDQDRIADLERAILAHNHDVTALASPLDLHVKDRIGTGILAPDMLDMARRIAQAKANHANRPRNRSTSRNRNLKYTCPTCNRPVRSAGDTRIVLCGGIYEAPHDIAVCILEEMPINRAEDAGYVEGFELTPASETDGRSFVVQSTVQMNAAKQRQAQAQAKAPLLPIDLDAEIPF